MRFVYLLHVDDLEVYICLSNVRASGRDVYFSAGMLISGVAVRIRNTETERAVHGNRHRGHVECT